MKKSLCQAALCSLLAFGLLATSAWALVGTQDALLPGVNSAGALDIFLGAVIPLRINLNTNTGRFTGKGKGQVQNLSGRTQQFDNAPIFSSSVTSNRYTVKQTGACSVTFSGAISVP